MTAWRDMNMSVLDMVVQDMVVRVAGNLGSAAIAVLMDMRRVEMLGV